MKAFINVEYMAGYKKEARWSVADNRLSLCMSSGGKCWADLGFCYTTIAMSFLSLLEGHRIIANLQING